MRRTFVDSGVLIAGSRGGVGEGAAAVAVLEDRERVFLSSAFVRLEVVPKASFHRQRDEVEFYELFFARVAEWADSWDRLLAEADRQATRHGLNALDALHVAAALALRADELITTERPTKPIHRVTSVKVVSIHPAARARG